jgi:hypothetical protein
MPAHLAHKATATKGTKTFTGWLQRQGSGGKLVLQTSESFNQRIQKALGILP